MVIGRLVAVSALVAGLSCVSTAPYHEAHRRRGADINARYDAERAERKSRARELLMEIDGLRTYLVAVRAGAGYSPVRRVEAQAELVDLAQKCRELGDQLALPPGATAADAEEFRVSCRAKVSDELYLPTLRATYYLADFDDMMAMYRSSSDADLEALLAYSHNTNLLRERQGMGLRSRGP